MSFARAPWNGIVCKHGRGPRAYARSILHVPFIRIIPGFERNDDLQKAIGWVVGYLVAGVSGVRGGVARGWERF